MLTMEQATNLSVVLHDALGRANDSILTHPLDPEEIQELIDELLRLSTNTLMHLQTSG